MTKNHGFHQKSEAVVSVDSETMVSADSETAVSTDSKTVILWILKLAFCGF